MRTRLPLFVLALLSPAAAWAQGPNVWSKIDTATIVGRRWDVPIGYSPELKRVLVLGGRSSYADYRKPRSYDVLSFNPADKCWDNEFPVNKSWGPKSGPCEAPAWKGESWGFRDVDGNIRPNWTIYGTFSLGQKYDYDPDTKAFYFYAGGSTFKYDPAQRTWTDLNPADHPEKALGGRLLWSSMVYDAHNRRFVLFGGGNVQSPRGDPGTWTYSPAKNAWTPLNLKVEPPQRANSRLAYDPAAKKIVLFGGDQLDQLLADTWLFDVTKDEWSEIKPPVGPSPRAGHGMVYLPKAKKILLVGGYSYSSTVDYVASLYRRPATEMWTYDVAAGRWGFLARGGVKDGPDSPTNFFASVAADGDDNLLMVTPTSTWRCAIDLTRHDVDASPKVGVPPGTVERRTGSHDPAWYKDVPPADPAAVAAELKALPANTWVERKTPKKPGMNMDWGSAVFDAERDLIVRFSGGHSAYSGTAPVVYDIKTDRYALPFAPEYPIEYVYSNDQVHGEWSFKQNPWMTGHTYKSTGYDSNLKLFVFAPHDFTYFFDPTSSKWSRSPGQNPYRPSFYVTTVCDTPKGAVAWGHARSNGAPSLWRLDADSRSWKPLPLKGPMPETSADHHGMAYDAKRDRLLLFSDLGKNKGDVLAYDFAAGESKWLETAGRDAAKFYCRETAYLPDLDAVLIGAHWPGTSLWPIYDCAANKWKAAQIAGVDPVGKRPFNNSMGLMHDPARRLVWAVGQHSEIYVLRLDRSAVRDDPSR